MDRITYMVAASGPSGYTTINSNPSDRRLERRDVLIIDTAAPVDGYFCDFDRNYAFGLPDDSVRRAFDLAFAATDAGIAACVPGARACDVWKAMARVLGAGDAERTGVGRMGHGIGLNMTEPPSIHPNDQTLLETGMVLAIEPGAAYKTATGRQVVMVHEENIVITEGRAALLSRRAPDRMPVIGDLP
jgi:Xaa-Pro dipeptidase